MTIPVLHDKWPNPKPKLKGSTQSSQTPTHRKCKDSSVLIFYRPIFGLFSLEPSIVCVYTK